MTASDSPRIAAVVLAAGTSTRMGGANKLIADIDGVPMVRRVVTTLCDLTFADRVVVTGHDAGRVRAALEGLDVRFSHNPDYAEGIASSIRTGVRALDAIAPALDGALIALGDMPWLDPADVKRLLDAFDPRAQRGICVPVRAGRRGNPVLWATRYFPDLRSLAGDTGGRKLLERFAADVQHVPARSDGVLLDVDSPDTLATARSLARGADPS